MLFKNKESQEDEDRWPEKGDTIVYLILDDSNNYQYIASKVYNTISDGDGNKLLFLEQGVFNTYNINWVITIDKMGREKYDN